MVARAKTSLVFSEPSNRHCNWIGAVRNFIVLHGKGISLPGQTITEIPVNFRGRQLFVAGDRTFETWTTTILNDTDFAIRERYGKMDEWYQRLETNTGVSSVI